MSIASDAPPTAQVVLLRVLEDLEVFQMHSINLAYLVPPVERQTVFHGTRVTSPDFAGNPSDATRRPANASTRSHPIRVARWRTCSRSQRACSWNGQHTATQGLVRQTEDLDFDDFIMHATLSANGELN